MHKSSHSVYWLSVNSSNFAANLTTILLYVLALAWRRKLFTWILMLLLKFLYIMAFAFDYIRLYSLDFLFYKYYLMKWEWRKDLIFLIRWICESVVVLISFNLVKFSFISQFLGCVSSDCSSLNNVKVFFDIKSQV